MVKLTTYASVIIVTLVGTYPFYEVVSSVKNLQWTSFIPCSDKPCYFKQLVSNADMPSTQFDVIQVQNNVSRPLRLIENLSVAEPILFRRTVARTRMFAFGYFIFGGFVHQWPAAGNRSVMEQAWEACYILCWDDKGHVRLPGPWFRSEHIDNARARVQKWGPQSEDIVAYLGNHADVSNAVKELSTAASKDHLHWLSYQVSLLAHAFANTYEIVCVWLSSWSGTASGPSGPEFLEDSNCGVDICNKEETHRSIKNPLSTNVSVAIYMVALVVWAVGKIVHDLSLLCGVREDIPMMIGNLTLLFQGLAVAAGLMAAIGAMEVFSARVHVGHAHSAGFCRCYYKIPDLNAILMMVSPGLLKYTWLDKAKRLAQAAICGDYLYYTQYDAPYHVVSQHRGWEDLSLLPLRAGDGQDMHVRVVRESSASLPSGIALLWVFGISRIMVFLSTLLSSLIIFPRMMALLTELAADPTWSAGYRWFVLRAAMLCPVAVAAFGGMGICKCPQSGPKLLGLPMTGWMGIFLVGLLVVGNYSLFLPPWEVWAHGSSVSSYDMHVLINTWSAGGLILAYLTHKKILDVIGPGVIFDVLRFHLFLASVKSPHVPHWLVSNIPKPNNLRTLAESNPDMVHAYGLDAWVKFASTWDADGEETWPDSVSKRISSSSGSNAQQKLLITSEE